MSSFDCDNQLGYQLSSSSGFVQWLGIENPIGVAGSENIIDHISQWGDKKKSIKLFWWIIIKVIIKVNGPVINTNLLICHNLISISSRHVMRHDHLRISRL